ncbi:hypothetical protein GC169_10340 [bacterium]|nr:hypothetical protein [bacterium]
MRLVAGFLVTSCLLAAPAFADPQGVSGGRDGADGSATGAFGTPVLNIDPSSTRLGRNSSAITVDLAPQSSALAPAPSDQWAFDFRTGSRWGLTLDLTKRADTSLLPREQVTAGAYYQVTPRFRFGGGVTIGGDSIGTAARGLGEEESEAGVRFESAFSF